MRRNFDFNPTAVNGVGSWYNPLTWSIVTGYDTAKLQSDSNALDAQLAAINQEAATTGQISQDNYDATVQHLAQQISDTQTQPSEINQGFVEGALSGYQSELAVLEGIPKYAGKIVGDVTNAVVSGTTSGAGSIIGGVLKAIPWWVWAGGVVYLFIHLGGGGYVERRARHYLSQ